MMMTTMQLGLLFIAGVLCGRLWQIETDYIEEQRREARRRAHRHNTRKQGNA